MNLLYTITAYPPAIGGAQFYTRQLAQHMVEKYPVEVVSLWETNRTDWLLGTTLRAAGEKHDYDLDGIPVHRLGFSRAEKLRMAPAVLAYYPGMDAALPYLAALLRPHLFPYAQRADLVHNIRVGREPLSLASLQAARQRDIPFFFTPLHHPHWSGWLYRHYQRIYRQADGLIALTGWEKRLLVGLGVKEERIFVTGIGPLLAEQSDGAAFRRQYALGNDPLVLFLGQKYEYKGIAALLGATGPVWARFPETRFVFIGPRTGYSRQVFAEAIDQRILELDSVSLQEKTDALAACTLLCVPSSQESFGGVYTEAWSLGKPVIGGLIPAVAEVISDSEDGFLTPQQPEEIASRILALLAEPTLSAAFGAAGQRKVQAHYTWSQLAARTEQAYLSVLAGEK